MRYYYEKTSIYSSLYGKTYICNHPVYDKCTLYLHESKGLAVIQQRYNNKGITTKLNKLFGLQ